MTLWDAIREAEIRIGLKTLVDSVAEPPKTGDGVQFQYSCPFHQDKKPSFGLHSRLNVFHCLSCGKGGNIYTFARLWVEFDIGIDHAGRRDVFRFWGTIDPKFLSLKLTVVDRPPPDPESKVKFLQNLRDPEKRIIPAYRPRTPEEKRFYIAGIMMQLDEEILDQFVKHATNQHAGIPQEVDLLGDILGGL
jgi:hypothetical protein